jgi:hypothetical protein
MKRYRVNLWREGTYSDLTVEVEAQSIDHAERELRPFLGEGVRIEFVELGA